MVLLNSKHEHFAQECAKGVSPTAAYVKVGYSPSGAHSSATRLLQNAAICARIKEIKTAVAEKVMDAEIRKRSWRVAQLQGLVDDMLSLRAARKVLYANQLGEGQVRKVANLAEETAALAEGFEEVEGLPQPTRALASDLYPKNLLHPGFPNGGSTGMLVKDYRGKNAEQEIWKFDGGLVSQINDTLKQAAIEEGQWTEKRDISGSLGISIVKSRLNAGRDRVAAMKKALDEAKAKRLEAPKP